jgi:hypothetical protein
MNVFCMRPDRSGRTVWDIKGIRPLKHWSRGFEGSNPTWGKDVYVCLFCRDLCVGSGVLTAWSSSNGSYSSSTKFV